MIGVCEQVPMYFRTIKCDPAENLTSILLGFVVSPREMSTTAKQAFNNDSSKHGKVLRRYKSGISEFGADRRAAMGCNDAENA